MRVGKRITAGILAVVLTITGMGNPFPFPAAASDIWPQRSTAPFYCLDGGKSWRHADRYDNYKYDTLPSPITEKQAKRLFWAYPSNWKALKAAAARYDPELYAQIQSTTSGPNTVKYVKDDAGTRFAWIADNPEIEARAIAVMEQSASEGGSSGKEAPDEIRDATSEENAVAFQVLPFSDGPAALDTEFVLGKEFIRDIAKIEPQSVWDNGSDGGAVGWLDASQEKNIAKSVMGENLYEVTWSGDSIRIHNNGSVLANENAVGSDMTEEEKYNKTTVRYKITMRSGSGWYTDGSWNEDYLHEWMDFKACINAPGHQRLYKADIRIVPSDQVFYLVISQDGESEGGGGGGGGGGPEYGSTDPEISFQVFRHEETFASNYNVRLKKYDDETGMPLKGSQFYLYERFEDEALLGSEENAGLAKKNLSFSPWTGFQAFFDGTTDEKGEITYRDTRTYRYSKTYCDGHAEPIWSELTEESGDSGEESENLSLLAADDGVEEDSEEAAGEDVRDKNRAAAAEWLRLVEDCEEKAENGDGTHFHWLIDEGLYDEIAEIAESGETAGGDGSQGADAETAFEESGCQADCEETYEAFIGLRFTYTWKEIQARTGYILHGLHADDLPIELVTTDSSEAGANALFAQGDSRDIRETVWYNGNGSREEEAGGNAGRSRAGSGSKRSSRAAILRFRLEESALEAEKESDTAASETGSVKGNERSESLSADGMRIASDADSEERPMTTAADAAEAAITSDSDGIFEEAAAVPDTDGIFEEAAADSDTDEIFEETATASDADENPEEMATASDARHSARKNTAASGEVLRQLDQKLRLEALTRLLSDTDDEDSDDGDDSDWKAELDLGSLEDYLEEADADGIDHLEARATDRYSHCQGKENCGDAWRVYDHRTEGRLHINKRDLDLYRKESREWSSYAETEGDATLEGAVYGLFAAENIVHPDAEVGTDGALTNTGIVYRKHDLAAVASTDAEGNADFLCYTTAPGATYSYEEGKIIRRTDAAWPGPVNRYDDNQTQNGNYWIGRPLILGSYYVKELSRSEGFELSVNGLTAERTNKEAGLETPDFSALSGGTAVVSIPEGTAMEGEDGSGKGYDELLFSVTSAGTGGYELELGGFPEGTEVFRIDTGETEVTGPHIVGTEETILKDSDGNILWETAESDTSNVKYQPEYDGNGTIVGQVPQSRTEDQVLIAEQIPEKKRMQLKDLTIDASDARFAERLADHDLSDPEDPAFLFIKAQTEELLNRNGYEIPVNAAGLRSAAENPVYSRGVKKGEPDLYAQTTEAGEPAEKTVYGAAIQELIWTADDDLTAADAVFELLRWYQENPVWSYGGIDAFEKTDGGYRITLYADVSEKTNRRFFVRKEESGKLDVDCIYSVYENPQKLRWGYQAYRENGTHRFLIENRYYMGNGAGKRYYVDAVLTPAILVNAAGEPEAVRHQVMVYHKAGEEIVDYLSGIPENGFRVPKRETTDRIEITTERELTEKENGLSHGKYEPETGTYRIPVKTEGTDAFGRQFTDREGSLTLQFSVKLKRKTIRLTEADIRSLGDGNVWDYREGQEIGYAQYLLRFAGASLSVSKGTGEEAADTYIVSETLVYRGQNRISEDGNTGKLPLQVLERPIKQKIRIEKKTNDGQTVGNFRFKAYLKSNLERLFCDSDGTISWIDRNGEPLDPEDYRAAFPELVPVFTTENTGRRLLETVSQTMKDGESGKRQQEVPNYEKFFEAVETANTDKWHNSGEVRNTSSKPFAYSSLSGLKNGINTSYEAAENAKRSDAVRQFAVSWYLKDEIAALTKTVAGTCWRETQNAVSYTDEIYDKALYRAIQRAEDYLKPFFRYDLDSIYEIAWDCEADGGIDGDHSTLSADHIQKGIGYAWGISAYLPYGTYVIAEQQPFSAQYGDLPNRYYQKDAPKEIELPAVYEAEDGEEIPETSKEYIYRKESTPNELAARYLIRFNEEGTAAFEEAQQHSVIAAHSHDGDFEVYPYGLDRDRTSGHYEPYGNQTVAAYYHYRSDSEHGSVQDGVRYTGGAASDGNRKGYYFRDGVSAMTGVQTAYDGKYAPMLVPWSVAEPAKGKQDLVGYGRIGFMNRQYRVKLRIEKLDRETGENLMHDGAVFALYRAKHEEEADSEGAVLRYQEPTVIHGSRQFLEAMGAESITPFARTFLERIADAFTSNTVGESLGAGALYSGTVPAGTPICEESSVVLFSDQTGKTVGEFGALSTDYDGEAEGILQTTGYLETPEPVEAGVYVLAELKPPAGYVRSRPIAVEVYSDRITYTPRVGGTGKTAVYYTYEQEKEGNKPENEIRTARLYIEDLATGLEISKKKTGDTSRGMKISGRVEGTISELEADYGLENLELAYNASGSYLGFGWRKGMLEYLEERKAAGERIELVFEDGVFQGYGYVTRRLASADDENRYVAGATLALYDAIRVRATGDTEDFAFEGVEVSRDRNGNVTEILVKEGYAGEKTEFTQENGVWYARTIQRKDTPVLFYDLGELRVFETDSGGKRYGYDRKGNRMRLTSGTESVYIFRGGKAIFELAGGDLTETVYRPKEKAFTALGEQTVLYHLDDELCRDAQVDPYTGLAYLEKTDIGVRRKTEITYYLWPVTVSRSENGEVLAMEKILTGRPGEIQAGTEQAYLTGTWNAAEKRFEKKLRPYYDLWGLAGYYKKSSLSYQKGEVIRDRDGDAIRYRYDDLLESYNRAAYTLLDHEMLFDADNPDASLYRREGEAYLLPNIWKTGDQTPQDGTDQEMTVGQTELLRRVVPGTYILEETDPPSGYVKAMPSALCVTETEKVQREAMTDERIKVEIAKVDFVDNYRTPITEEAEPGREPVHNEMSGGKGGYSGKLISGVKLALYPARRVLTTDYETWPNGYYFVRTQSTPAVWNVENPVDNSRISCTGMWITGNSPQYFEGIPAGDYILEEVETPPGYVPASMEITIEETEKLQSFLLHEDHTKLEILKYEKYGDEKRQLTWEKRAKLALYPAIADSSGNLVSDGGQYLWDTEREIDSWYAGDRSALLAGFRSKYEEMFSEYGTDCSEFYGRTKDASDSSKTEIVQRLFGSADPDESGEEFHAVRTSGRSYGNDETVVQLWELADQTVIRVTAVKNGKLSGNAADGRPEYSFEYQFNYRSGFCEEYPQLISYDTEEGYHRLDRIPAGSYVLVETETPAGYEPADPKLIQVTENGEIKRIGLENKRGEQELPKGELVIQKLGTQKQGLPKTWFELANDETGDTYRLITDRDGRAELSGLPAGILTETGELRYYRYTLREIKPPAGHTRADEIRRIEFRKETSYRYEITVIDEETEFLFSKTAFQAADVEGARLYICEAAVKNGEYYPDGVPIESWVSAGEAHRVIGKLSAGKRYFLIEEEAPAGYAKEKPILFAISADGKRISEITDSLTTVRILAGEDGKSMEALAFSGRTVEGVRYRLLAGEEELAVWQGTGIVKKIGSETAEAGSVVTFCEELVFSDGTVLSTGRETVRLRLDEKGEYRFKERIPIRHEFSFKTEGGKRLTSWEALENDGSFRFENRKNENGEEVLEKGGSYLLDEILWFSDGSYLTASSQRLSIGNDGMVHQLSLLNRQTEVRISKTDMVTDAELPGAKLTLKDSDGSVVDQWISEKTPHWIIGGLRPGQSYTLSEETAPDGYEIAEEITFTVSETGEINRVTMEDGRKPKPEEPEPEKPKPEEPKSEEPKPEEPKPEEPEPEKPRTPTPAGPEPEIPKEPAKEPEKIIGRVDAAYTVQLEAQAAVRLKSKDHYRIRLPKTGDESEIGLYRVLLTGSLAALVLTMQKRRRRDEKEK